MKYAICNEVYQDWPLDQAFEHAASLGYTGVEIAPFTLNKDANLINGDQRREVVQLAQKHRLQIVGLHWLLAHTEGFHLTSKDKSVRDATVEYLKVLARLCRDLGGELMVLGSPHQRNRSDDVTKEMADEFMMEAFSKLNGTLADLNVVVALEPLGPEEGNYLLTADETVSLIKKIGSPNVRLHLDVKAMSTEGTPIETIIEKHQNDLVHFHANDPNRQGPGMGDVDFKPIFGALNNVGYAGWVSVEVFDYSPGIETLTAESIRYMKEIEAEFKKASSD